MAQPFEVSVFGLRDVPHVGPGDDLCELVVDAVNRNGLTLETYDVVILAQKIVSKAEGRLVRMADIEPSTLALEVARRSGKDERMAELILRESASLLRVTSAAVIAEHRNGRVMANAGIDQSNLADNTGDEWALLLPEDPDTSAQRLRAELWESVGAEVGVIINDTFGRPFREGVTGCALGVAGWPALIDRRGTGDLFGRPMTRTVVAHADELAAAASMVQGQAAEGRPIVIVRGLRPHSPNGSGRDLLRDIAHALFR